MTHFVGRVDWDRLATPLPASANASGLSRSVLVGPDQGAVHTELAIGQLQPGGWIQRHVHSVEEALYVLSGKLLFELDGHVHRLHAGDYVFIPIGLWHALGNSAGEPVRWLSVNTPQRLGPETDRRDTWYAREPFDLEAFDRRAARPAFGNPTLRWVGHYAGTPPQLEALAVKDPARGRAPVGMDVAILAYSGISVKMLVDRVFGADLLTLFTVDYELGGAAQSHDHPFEETYFFLEGTVSAELDGIPYTLRPGDVVFAGVGSVHGFWNEGTERVRWLETQAPQPPVRHAYRWAPAWQKFENELGGGS